MYMLPTKIPQVFSHSGALLMTMDHNTYDLSKRLWSKCSGLNYVTFFIFQKHKEDPNDI